MPDWVDGVRGVIFVVVWAVLVLRVPAALQPRQRPVWVVLVMMAAGSLALQAPVARWVNEVAGIAKANELLLALTALADFAALWWFALVLHSAGHTVPTWLRRAPVACALVMAVLAVVFFLVTPAPARFGVRAHGWWVGYAISWTCYGTITAVGAASLFWRHGPRMRSPVLRVSVLAMAVGCSAEIPYLVIRCVRWFDAGAAPGLAVVGFWFSFSRFVLVALGCSLAALEPLRQSVVYWYRRQRLYPLWHLLREATPQLTVTPPPSRAADLVTIKDNWDHLHQRVVEIRDSISFLHNGWASPELLRDATRYAGDVAPPDRRRLTAIACWLEVARRAALAGSPKLHHELDGGLLPEVLAEASTVAGETRHLAQLRRALRARAVQSFADDRPILSNTLDTR